MKKIAKLLLVAIICSLVLALVSCGGDKKSKYTITEKEWKAAFSADRNVTEKQETYRGDEEGTIRTIKYANGYVCFCENEDDIWGDAPTTTTASTTVTGGIIGGSTSGSSTSGSSTSGTTNSITGGTMGTFWFSSSSDLPPTTSVAGGIGSTAWDKVILDVNRYESFAPTVSEEKVEVVSTYYTCWYFDGEKYYQFMPNDEDGNKVAKWLEYEEYPNASGKLFAPPCDFDELEYDEDEKAYVYCCEHEDPFIEDQITQKYSEKFYFYFEDGKLVKTVQYWATSYGGTIFPNGEDPYDVSGVTPKDPISSEYSTTITTYENHGKTKVDHTFNKKDVVTKIED